MEQLNLEYAIQNINLRIEPGQKIGIIGRTGTLEYLNNRFF
jgi:ABC-type multidrug transport system fused ATPase/permease subunit